MNKIIASLAFSAEKAEILYNQNRYILIRPDTVVEFQKRVEEAVGPGASDLMFKAAFEIGSRIGRTYVETSTLSQREMIDSMVETANELGWARLSLKDTGNFPDVVILQASNSAFASAYGQSKTPVCHLIREVFAGALSKMLGPVRESQEIECLSMGHPRCAFGFKLQSDSITPG